MTAFLTRLAALLADRASPLLVRHARQQLRSRYFIGTFLSMLLVGAVFSVVLGVLSDLNPRERYGVQLFAAVGLAWAFALLVMQPSAVFTSIARERDEETWELVILTGLRPLAFLSGMIQAGLVQGLLCTAAAAPYMLLSWLLGGVDLLAMAVVMAGVLAAHLGFLAVAAMLAAVCRTKAQRQSMRGLLTLALVGPFLSCIPVMFAMHEWSNGLSETFFREPAAFWAVLGACANLLLAVIAVALSLASSQLSLATDDRSSGPRLAWLAVYLNALAWFVLVPVFAAPPPRLDELAQCLLVFSFLGNGWLMALGVFAVTEDVHLSPRQARAVSRGPAWKRAAMLVLGPGAARGRLALLALLICQYAILAAIWWMHRRLLALPHWHLSKDEIDALNVSFAILSYFLVILVLSEWLQRRILDRWIAGGAMARRVGFAVTALAACALPVFPLWLEVLPWLSLASPWVGCLYLGDPSMLTGLDPSRRDVFLAVLAGAGACAAAILAVQAFRHLRPEVRVATAGRSPAPTGL